MNVVRTSERYISEKLRIFHLLSKLPSIVVSDVSQSRVYENTAMGTLSVQRQIRVCLSNAEECRLSNNLYFHFGDERVRYFSYLPIEEFTKLISVDELNRFSDTIEKMIND